MNRSGLWILALASAGMVVTVGGSAAPRSNATPVQIRVPAPRPLPLPYVSVVRNLDVAGLQAAFNKLWKGRKTGGAWKYNRAALLTRAQSIAHTLAAHRYPGTDTGLKYIDAQLAQNIGQIVTTINANPKWNQTQYGAVSQMISIVATHRDALLFYLGGQCTKGSSDTTGCDCPKTHAPDLRSCYPYSERWTG